MNFDALSQSNKLSAIERQISEMIGEQNSLIRRREILLNEVGLAKGRLANKSKVSEFLEQLQADANARLVSNYEMLLTALVQEVLTNEAPIGLDLQIERGQPSLDIISRRSNDRSEDIYEDQGGALTNLVSLGLRMIGVVRSGMNRFLLLDESDCWVATERVPPFYAVVKDAARKIGIQCLAVSHHDVATFSEGISIAKLTGHPEHPGGVRIENNPRPHQWTNEETGIRWIRLKNFQGYIDETLHMSPGINALVGDNNIGKSSFVRAFRAVFYGEARDSLIRWGERMCTVEFGMPGGRVLSWDRQTKRNPINRWRYLEADGSLVSEDFNTGGRTVPDWVMSEFKIGPLEGMEIHAIKQKEPVFLLNQSASKRAAVLSIGQEASHIRTMLTLHKEQCSADSAKIKEGEVEMSSLLERLDKLEKLPEYQRQIQKASDLLKAIHTTTQETANLEKLANELNRSTGVRSRAGLKLEALSQLPSNDEFRHVEFQAQTISRLGVIAESIETAVARVASKQTIQAVLARLPTTGPSLINNEKFVISLDQMEKAAHRIEACKKTSTILSALPDVTPELHDVQSLKNTVAVMSSAKASIERNAKANTILLALPETMPEIIRNDDALKCGKALRDIRIHASKVLAQNKILAQVPEQMPQIDEIRTIELALSSVNDAAKRVLVTKQKLVHTETDIKNVESELETVVASMGHTCPLCHSTIGSAASLLGHSHTEEHAHD